MKGIVLTAAGAPLVFVDTLDKPVPGPGQILVRSIAAAMNPVDPMMQSTGILIPAFPTVLGCDASGIVEEVGQGVEGFRVGDRVCGCTRLGIQGHGTWEEYFLMDAIVTTPTPKNVSIEQASTLGVGTYTACLGLFDGLQIPLPDVAALPSPKDEWIIVIGGAGSVGQYGVQMAKACGYKVLATCSAKNEALVKSLGASGTLDYHLSEANQLSAIKSLTGGNFAHIFDAAGQGYSLAVKALSELSTVAGGGYYATIDDWSLIDPIPRTTIHRISLGPVGRDGAQELNRKINSYIPVIVGLVEKGLVKPNEVEVLGKGLEELIGVFGKGAVGGGKKGVVLVGSE
ncbi:MAG: hypothetical protein M1840_002045 [Geoglossum simile]|nr:MAG: hypothetical protein M1840_002045 [Geoglossum simile]